MLTLFKDNKKEIPLEVVLEDESWWSVRYGERVVSPEKARELINKGWAAADLHVHSWGSFDVLPIEETSPFTMYKKAMVKGFRFVTFTDHDSMDVYDRFGWTREGLVTGVEIKILDPVRVGHTLHINIYELDRNQFLELENIALKDKNLETFIDYLQDNDLPYIYNHPFWHEPDEKPSIKSILDIAELFPVIEYNMGRVSTLNRQAMMLAERYAAGITASTDTHIGEIGRAFTLAKGDTFKEYYNEIKMGRSLIVPQDLDVDRFTIEAHQRIQNLFNKEKWYFDKPAYTVKTGIKYIDRLVNMVVNSDNNDRQLMKKLLKLIMEGIVNSRIPASLYVKGQNQLALRIRETVKQIGCPVLAEHLLAS